MAQKEKFIKNNDLSYTVLSLICKKFKLNTSKQAAGHFEKGFNESLVPTADKIIENLFSSIESVPVEYLGYPEANKNNRSIPCTFLLDNGKTLALHINKSSNKVAPDILGQAGYPRLNEFFAKELGREIKDKEDIKELILEHFPNIANIFLDYLFKADIVAVYTKKKDNYEGSIFKDLTGENFQFDPEKFSFTREKKEDWNDSNTIKYDGIPLAEVQLHPGTSRTFKFRFYFDNIEKFINEVKKNNETLGMSAEYAICKMFSLEMPDSLKERADLKLADELFELLGKAFGELPEPIKYIGNEKGVRGKKSKNSHDFKLEGEKTLSVKTNYGKYVCPPEVGQPGGDTFLEYFSKILNIKEISPETFKKSVLEKADLMLPVYAHHLFGSDYLLWIFKKKDGFEYRIFGKNAADQIPWKKEKITFSQPKPEDWNECDSISYDGLSLGQFQVHKHRNSYKFRFHFENLNKIINKYKKD